MSNRYLNRGKAAPKRSKAAEWMRTHRAKRRAQGYVYRHFWIHPKDWPVVKAFLERYAPHD